MTATQPSQATENSLARDFLNAFRYYVGGRRGLIVIAGVVLAAGLWLGWPALAAAGLAPILLALAPCAVMCALGLCMGKSKRSGETEAPGALNAIDPDTHDPASPHAGCADCGGATEKQPRRASKPIVTQ